MDDLQDDAHQFVDLIKWEDEMESKQKRTEDLLQDSSQACGDKLPLMQLGFELGQIDSTDTDYRTRYCCITAVFQQ